MALSRPEVGLHCVVDEVLEGGHEECFRLPINFVVEETLAGEEGGETLGYRPVQIAAVLERNDVVFLSVCNENWTFDEMNAVDVREHVSRTRETDIWKHDAEYRCEWGLEYHPRNRSSVHGSLGREVARRAGTETSAVQDHTVGFDMAVLAQVFKDPTDVCVAVLLARGSCALAIPSVVVPNDVNFKQNREFEHVAVAPIQVFPVGVRIQDCVSSSWVTDERQRNVLAAMRLPECDFGGNVVGQGGWGLEQKVVDDRRDHLWSSALIQNNESML